MNFLFPEMKPPLDGPLGEAIEIIEKLRAPCLKHGLKREADFDRDRKGAREPAEAPTRSTPGKN